MLYPDTGTAGLTLTGGTAESEAHSASRAGTLTLTGSASEVHGWSDTGSGTVTLAGTRTESETHSRSGTAAVSLATGALQEFNTGAGFSDSPAPSIEFTLSGSGTQSASHTSSAAGTMTASGGRANSATQTGSRSGALTLGGAATEFQAHTYSDSGTGTVTFSYFDGRAYPGDFFPGQVYPGQTVVSTPTLDTNTRSGAGTFTLAGSGVESHQSGSTIVFTDHGTAVFTLTGAVAEDFGTLDTGAGTILFYGTGHDSGLQPTDVHAGNLTTQPLTPEQLDTTDVPTRGLTEVPADPAILTPA